MDTIGWLLILVAFHMYWVHRNRLALVLKLGRGNSGVWAIVIGHLFAIAGILVLTV